VVQVFSIYTTYFLRLFAGAGIVVKIPPKAVEFAAQKMVREF
jgi:hypothetical protein